MARRRMTAVLVLPLFLLLMGCPKDPYRAALQGSDNVAAAVHTAIAVTTDYYGNGLVSDSEKATVANVLQVITVGNMTFRHCVVAAHNANAAGQAPYLACADAFASQVATTDPSLLGFKNPKAQEELRSYLQAVKTAINGISLAIQSAKGGK